MRRRRSRTAPGEHDSFLDTMTNVVGILIIVAMVIRVSVGDTVARGTRPTGLDVSPERLLELQGQEKGLDEQLPQLLAKNERLGPASEWAAAEIAQAESWLEGVRGSLDDPDLLRRDRSKVAEQRVARTEAIQLLEERRDQLDVSLRTLKAALERAGSALADRETLSVPRPDPTRAEGKTRRYLYCRGGQVVPLDHDELRRRLYQELERAVGSLEVADISARLDLALSHFVARDIGNPFFRLNLVGSRTKVRSGYSVFLKVVYEMRGGVGFGGSPTGPAAAGTADGTPLAAWLDSLDPASDWVSVLVWDEIDSFRTYLAARSAAEARGLAVGWDAFPRGVDAETILIGSRPATSQIPD